MTTPYFLEAEQTIRQTFDQHGSSDCPLITGAFDPSNLSEQQAEALFGNSTEDPMLDLYLDGLRLAAGLPIAACRSGAKPEGKVNTAGNATH